MPTSDRQMTTGLGHGETGTVAGPSARRERPFPWTGGNPAAGEQAAAPDERRDEHTTCWPPSHASFISRGAARIQRDGFVLAVNGSVARTHLINAAQHRGRRGARLARRDDREYRPYARKEQRRQPGCIAGRMPAHL